MVLGFDGSPASHRALRWAADAALDRGATLRIVYASPGDPEHVLDHARHLAQSTRPSLDIETTLVDDAPAHALIEASKRADLLVVGNRGHGGLHDLLLGSTSLQTATNAHAPVAVIRPTQLADPDGGVAGRIIVAVDGSEAGQAAMKFAFEEARLTGRPVTAVHAWEAPITTAGPGMMPWVLDYNVQRQQEEDVMREAIKPWRDRYPDIEISTKSMAGPASAVLVQESMGAYLIVAGSHGHALIHHAGCPVVLAHVKERATNSS